jgi:hypothetical protein
MENKNKVSTWRLQNRMKTKNIFGQKRKTCDSGVIVVVWRMNSKMKEQTNLNS